MVGCWVGCVCRVVIGGGVGVGVVALFSDFFRPGVVVFVFVVVIAVAVVVVVVLAVPGIVARAVCCVFLLVAC